MCIVLCCLCSCIVSVDVFALVHTYAKKKTHSSPLYSHPQFHQRMMEEEQHGKDAAILQELRDISNRHSPYYYNSSNNNHLYGNRSTTSSDKENNSVECRDQVVDKTLSLNTTDKDDNDKTNTFLTHTNENRDLNQYWYSKKTIDTLCTAIREGLTLVDGGSRVAFLSTPSLFFSLSPKERQQCVLFDVSSC